jgi:hypothetical protein
MQAGQGGTASRCACTPSARCCSALWQACDYAVFALLFGATYANVMLVQTVLWRAIWGVVAYAAIATGLHRLAAGARAPARRWPPRRPNRRWRAPSWR